MRLFPVSIVIPYFNSDKTILSTSLSAVANLNHPDDELIIVNDGSDLSMVSVLDDIAALDKRIIIFSNTQNLGGGWTRNIAVHLATNEWIFCLDSDNLMPSQLLENFANFMRDNPCDGLVPERTVFFEDSSEKVTHTWKYDLKPLEIADHLNSQIVSSASGNYLFSKAAWEKAGGYPTNSGSLDAWGFGLRLAFSSARVLTVPNTFYLHRYGLESYWVREGAIQRIRNIKASSLLMEGAEKLPDFVLTKLSKRKVFENWFDKLSYQSLSRKLPKSLNIIEVSGEFDKSLFQTELTRLSQIVSK